MNNRNHLYASAFALVLTSMLAGCATLRNDGPDSCSEDASIEAKVQILFDGHPELGPPNAITVQSINRVVYLYGLVDTGQEKWAAESLASKTRGVTRVVNSIEQDNQ